MYAAAVLVSVHAVSLCVFVNVLCVIPSAVHTFLGRCLA